MNAKNISHCQTNEEKKWPSTKRNDCNHFKNEHGTKKEMVEQNKTSNNEYQREHVNDHFNQNNMHIQETNSSSAVE